MNATRTPTVRSLALALVAALAFGLVASAQAQSTDAEQSLRTILANDTDGIVVTCPATYPISDLAACFVLSADFDLARMQIERSIRQYNDASWPVPWSLSDDRSVQSRFLEVTGQPMFIIFMTPDYAARNSDYSTVVWVIEQERFP